MISVIIPVYNGEKYLDECLSSISGTDIEIIVIDDASTDNSAKIASKYTNQVITVEHGGPVIARNTGLAHANGDFVLFMDADDILKPDAISELSEKIMDNDIIIGLREDFVSPDCQGIKYENKTSSHGVIAGCALIRKNAFEKIGNFDQDLLCGDAYDWLLRAEKQKLKIKKIESVLCMRRIHNSNMGMTLKDQEMVDYAKIIRKHFAKK